MRLPTHPGKILKRELETIGLSSHALSMTLNVPASRIDRIVKEKRAVTPDTALRLARYFGGSAAFWLNLQTAHDLAVVEKKRGAEIRRTVPSRAA